MSKSSFCGHILAGFKTNVIQHADKRKMAFPVEEGIDQKT